MKDVYVTDHKHVAKKFVTLSDEEDMEYYRYVKSLEEYNKESENLHRINRFSAGRFEKGSLKQRIFEPLADAQTLENGTVFYEVSDKEMSRELNDEKLRATFDIMKNIPETIEGGEETEIRIAMFDAIEETGIELEEWDKILARELDTFKAGEKYDYTVDLRRTFDEHLAVPREAKIFAKIPDHVFWDIKTPHKGVVNHQYINPYNPARQYPFQSFFDMRSHEDWLEDRETKRNLVSGISRHNRV